MYCGGPWLEVKSSLVRLISDYVDFGEYNNDPLTIRGLNVDEFNP